MSTRATSTNLISLDAPAITHMSKPSPDDLQSTQLIAAPKIIRRPPGHPLPSQSPKLPPGGSSIHQLRTSPESTQPGPMSTVSPPTLHLPGTLITMSPHILHSTQELRNTSRVIHIAQCRWTNSSLVCQELKPFLLLPIVLVSRVSFPTMEISTTNHGQVTVIRLNTKRISDGLQSRLHHHRGLLPLESWEFRQQFFLRR
jgi:hypothetical protein